MTTFPLVHTKWSNEHIMTAVFGVSILYLLPRWVQNPLEVPAFAAVLVLALLIDTVLNFIRYKRPVCAVSAAVTAAILEVLAPGVPLWGRLLGITFALIIGKHIWGGTGKNGLNPAITGLLLLNLLFPISAPVLHPAFLLLPALVCSLFFISLRPFASAGYLLGSVIPLLFTHDLSLSASVTVAAVFWGCLVLTDPVTVTPHPLLGAVGGILCGLIPQIFSGFVVLTALCVLLFNILTFASERYLITGSGISHFRLRMKPIVPFSEQATRFYDLTDRTDSHGYSVPILSQAEFLKCIRENEVFGFGGAAFPTANKIKTVMEAETPEKHLVVNGVECDPGLIHDKWLLRHKMKEIQTGISLLQKQINFKTVTLAVKSMEGLTFPLELNIHKVRDFYPAGAERNLIHEIFGIKLSEKTIPAKEGILVLNVQTVLAVFEAVCRNRKADTRFLTVVDRRAHTNAVARVQLGTSVQKTLKAVYPAEPQSSAFCGGGAMQCHYADEDSLVDQSVNFIALSDVPYYKESPNCSHCGRCAAVCPVGIKVYKVASLLDKGKRIDSKYNMEKCVKCGACSFACPAGRNLSARIQNA